MRAEEIWMLLQEPIVGFEDADDESEDEEDSSSEDESDAEGDDEDDEGGDSDQEAESKEDTEGLKSALQKERKERKRLEREAKKRDRMAARQRAEEDDALKAARDENETLKQSNAKLAQGYLKTQLDGIITKYAAKARFRDIEDAINGIKVEDIDYDQDDDDPSDLEIDEASVEVAVNKLAEKKPHFVMADGDEEPSGSRFGGKKSGKKKDEADEQALRDKYPALRKG